MQAEVIQDREALPTTFPCKLVYKRVRQRSDLLSLFCLNRNIPLMEIRLYQMKNGGSILRIAASHSVSDGLCPFHFFFKSWMRHLHNLSDPVKPDFDRDCIYQIESQYPNPVTQDQSDFLEKHSPFSLWLLRLKIMLTTAHTQDYVFRVSQDNIERLCEQENPNGRRDIRKSDIVTAYLWRELSRYHSSETTYLSYLVTFRKLIENNKTKYLNAVVTRDLTEDKKTLVESSVEEIASKVRALYEDVSIKSVAGDLAFLTHAAQTNSSSTIMPKFFSRLLNTGILVNNMSTIRLYNSDLGTGNPVWIQPPSWDLPGFLYILRSPSSSELDIHLKIHNSQRKSILNGLAQNPYLTRIY